MQKNLSKAVNYSPSSNNKKNPNFIGGIEKSQKLSEIYEDIAMRNDCEFMGSEDLIVGEDGLHLSRDGHRILASKLSMKVQQILK